MGGAARRGGGTFLWSKATLGARRGELCALQIEHVELDDADSNIVTIRESLHKIKGKWAFHQHRRMVPDTETAAALREHIAQAQNGGRARHCAPIMDSSRGPAPGCVVAGHELGGAACSQKVSGGLSRTAGRLR
jgi:integrase